MLLKKANCWHCAEVNAAGCMAKCVQASLTFTFEDLRKVLQDWAVFFSSSVFVLGASSLVTILLPQKVKIEPLRNLISSGCGCDGEADRKCASHDFHLRWPDQDHGPEPGCQGVGWPYAPTNPLG